MCFLRRHAFGVKADVKDNVAYIDDNRIVFPCGNNVVIHNSDAKFQVSIPGGLQPHAPRLVVARD